MIFYVVHTILQVAKSLRQVYLKQVSEQILQVGAKVRRESYLQQRVKEGRIDYEALSAQRHGRQESVSKLTLMVEQKMTQH